MLFAARVCECHIAMSSKCRPIAIQFQSSNLQHAPRTSSHRALPPLFSFTAAGDLSPPPALCLPMHRRVSPLPHD